MTNKHTETTVEDFTPTTETSAPSKLVLQQALGESARVITNLEKFLDFSRQPIKTKDLGIVAQLELESGESIRYDIGLKTLMAALNQPGVDIATTVEFTFTKGILDALADVLAAVKEVNTTLEGQYAGTNS